MSEFQDDQNEVFALLQEYQWERALKEAKRSPKLVTGLYQVAGFYDAQIASKVNSLHLACILGAPFEIIRGLAQINPDAIREVDSKYGRVPLQIAVMNGAPITTVNTLLKIDPKTAQQRDRYGRIALHYACKDEDSGEISTRSLLKAYPDGSSIADFSGFLPLHVACRYGTSVAVVRMLIRSNPESIAARTQKGSTPLACAKHSKRGSTKEVIGVLERFADERFNRPNDQVSNSVATIESTESGLTAKS